MLGRLARMHWVFKIGIPASIAFGLYWAIKDYNMQTARAPIARDALQNAVAVDASVIEIREESTSSRLGPTSQSRTARYRFRDREGREWTGSASASEEELRIWAHPVRGDLLRDDARIAIVYNAVDPRVSGRRSILEEQVRVSWIFVVFMLAAGTVIGLMLTLVGFVVFRR